MTRKQLLAFIRHPAAVLVSITLVVYGTLSTQMGFYWDDIPITWIRYEQGPAALMKYFSGTRPFWGILHQITTAFIPQVPFYWVIFGLLWRWLAACAVRAVVVRVWPSRPRMAFMSALLFLLYPGFTQQMMGYMYGHFFIVFCTMMVSWWLMLVAITGSRWRTALTGAALILSALNLWMMEYFFALELLRPALLWVVSGTASGDKRLDQRLVWVLKHWLPYAVAFCAAVLFRLFVFNDPMYPIKVGQVGSLGASLWSAVLSFTHGLYTSVIVAWSTTIQLADVGSAGPASWAFIIATGAASGMLAGFTLDRMGEENASPEVAPAVAVSVVALLLAHVPFWMTGLVVSTTWPNDRFLVPAMFGAGLLLAALLELLPRQSRIAVGILIVMLASARQATLAKAFSEDWNTQRNLFWQISWRIPSLTTNTTVMLNEGALKYYSDNSLTGALNWIYAPERQLVQLPYLLIYPQNRLGGSLPQLEKGAPITHDLVVLRFKGTTSQVVALAYTPPGCLRVLDSVIDAQNKMIAAGSLMREAAQLSSTQWILPSSQGIIPAIYAPEPPHGWCYYFERADLARQLGKWEQVAALGDVALSLSDYPNDPIERFVFIEGYAHQGQWRRALDLTRQSYGVSERVIGPLLCKLWDRIAVETPVTPPSVAAVAEARSLLTCSP